MLNMTSHEIRVARLRNLFLIMGALTNVTPLNNDELTKLNYDVGLFDPRISEESKVSDKKKVRKKNLKRT